MSFCPQCGAPTSPTMSFCTACGRTLAPPAAPSAQAAPASLPAMAPPVAAASGRPVGKTVEPWIVVVLGIVTFGIYPLFLWWRASREVDAYAGSQSHALVRPGVIIAAVALVLGLALGVMAAMQAFAAILADPENPPDTMQITADMASNPLYALLALAQVVGAALLYTGLARMWRTLGAEETRLGRRDPLQPGPYIGIGIAAATAGALSSLLTYITGVMGDMTNVAYTALSSILGFASFGAFVALLWVMYGTQKRLNELWAASAPRPAGW